MLLAAYFFIVNQPVFSRLVLGYTWALTILFVYAGRWLVHGLQTAWFRIGGERRRVLIVGAGSDAVAVAEDLCADARFTVVGHLAVGGEDSAVVTLGQLGDLADIAATRNIDEVIIAARGLLPNVTHTLLNLCRERQLDFYIVPDLFGVAGFVDVRRLQAYRFYIASNTAASWGRVSVSLTS
jgi:FlaA1/EpsC-like NDP-sugar epimerase